MSASEQESRSPQILTAVARALEARQGLAQESVELLMEGLRSGDANAIHLGLRGLGITEHNEMYEKIGMMANSLHTLLQEFRLQQRVTDEPRSEANISNAAEKLERVMVMCLESSDRTTQLTEDVAELLRQQEYAMEIADEVLNDRTISDKVRHERLNEFISKQQSCAAAIRLVNQEVLMNQSVCTMAGNVLHNVIGVIHDLKSQIRDLKFVYGSGAYHSPSNNPHETEIIELE